MTARYFLFLRCIVLVDRSSTDCGQEVTGVPKSSNAVR